MTDKVGESWYRTYTMRIMQNWGKKKGDCLYMIEMRRIFSGNCIGKLSWDISDGIIFLFFSLHFKFIILKVGIFPMNMLLFFLISRIKFLLCVSYTISFRCLLLSESKAVIEISLENKLKYFLRIYNNSNDLLYRVKNKKHWRISLPTQNSFLQNSRR